MDHPQYAVGDVVNGHALTQKPDGTLEWVPLPPEAEYVDPVVGRNPRSWAWRIPLIIFLAVFVAPLITAGGPVAWIAAILVAAIIWGIVFARRKR
jgi:hypothetical protein